MQGFLFFFPFFVEREWFFSCQVLLADDGVLSRIFIHHQTLWPPSASCGLRLLREPFSTEAVDSHSTSCLRTE